MYDSSYYGPDRKKYPLTFGQAMIALESGKEVENSNQEIFKLHYGPEQPDGVIIGCWNKQNLGHWSCLGWRVNDPDEESVGMTIQLDDVPEPFSELHSKPQVKVIEPKVTTSIPFEETLKDRFINRVIKLFLDF